MINTTKKSEIIFNNIQIKSLEKFRKFAKALDVIEIECGINECRISLNDVFICPDIDFDLIKNKTIMEKFLLNNFIYKLK